MRWVGLLILSFCGFLGGELILFREKQTLTDLQSASRLVEYILTELEYKSSQMESLVLEIKEDSQWSVFCSGNDLCHLGQLKAPPSFSPGQAKRLEECFSSIGGGRVEEAVQELRYTVAWLSKEEAALAEVLSQHTKLYPPVGLCAGVAAAILML